VKTTQKEFIHLIATFFSFHSVVYEGIVSFDSVRFTLIPTENLHRCPS